MLNTKKSSFNFSPKKMRSDFKEMHNNSSSRKIILQSKIGAGYLKNKKNSLSGKMKGSPISMNAFQIGQAKIDVNKIIERAIAPPPSKMTQKMESQQFITPSTDFLSKIKEQQESNHSDCSSNLSDIENQIISMSFKDIVEIIDNSLTPDQVKVPLKQRRRLLEIKKAKGDEWSKAEHEYMKTLYRYWCPKCIYTANPKLWEKQVQLYSKNFLTESDLMKEVARVKQQYELCCMEEFSR